MDPSFPYACTNPSPPSFSPLETSATTVCSALTRLSCHVTSTVCATQVNTNPEVTFSMWKQERPELGHLLKSMKLY